MSTEVFLPGPDGVYMNVADIRIGKVKMKRPHQAHAFLHRRMVCEGYWWREAWFKPLGPMLIDPGGRWYAEHWIRVDDPPED